MKEICIQDCLTRQEKAVILLVCIAGSKVCFQCCNGFLVKLVPMDDVRTPLRCCRYRCCSYCLLTLLSGRLDFNSFLSFCADINLFSSNYLILFYISGTFFESFTLQKPTKVAWRVGAEEFITQQDLRQC